uniref:G-protein coupled receptors family 1 profile domain-containing protein n=1 Tax=Plectus sambesii TaxID=2011161 RepID=A0A914WR39_9BILA
MERNTNSSIYAHNPHHGQHDPTEDCSTNTPDIVRIRRYATFVANITGLFPCLIHLAVLVYLQWVRKSKSFEHLLAIAVLSVVTLVVSASGFAFDLCFLPSSGAFLFYRKNIWLFANNALFCAYAYMIVMLCLDRFLALHKPILYRDVFITPRMRVVMVLASIAIGSLCCCKWFVYYNASLAKLHNNTHSTVNEREQSERDSSTNEVWFTVVRLVSCIAQYFLPGALMIGFSVSNVQKLRYQEKKKHSLGKLRMAGPTAEFWQQSHDTVAHICTILAVCYCLLNWPYMFADYLYDDLRRTDVAFGILTIFGNFMQCFYLQINLFVFAYRSRLYRRTLIHLLYNAPCRFVKHLFARRLFEEDAAPKEGTPSLRTIIHSTRFVELMAVL